MMRAGNYLFVRLLIACFCVLCAGVTSQRSYWTREMIGDFATTWVSHHRLYMYTF